MTDRDDDDLVAAEYALGTLDGAERADASRRRSTDAAFSSLIDAWDLRLAPLSEGARDVVPPPQLWDGILARLGLSSAGQGEAVVAGNVVALNRAVVRWRRATIVLSALAACLALVVAIDALRLSTLTPPTLVAVLQKTADSPAYLVRANIGERSLSVRSINAAAPAGRSYELWLIDPQLGAPKSLGVLDRAVSLHALPSGLAPDLLSRATYAVTEEQAGGSPTGAPTSAPILIGHLVSTAP